MTKYVYNKEFFYKESPELFYFLGFVMADGHYNKLKKSIEITLAIKDICILEKFKEWTCPDYKIRIHENNGKLYCSFSVNSSEIFKYLINKYKFNCKKTGNESFPSGIEDKYVPHFIRGYFDGDGNAYLKNKRMQVSIVCSSKEFLDEMKDRIGYGIVGKHKMIYVYRVMKTYNTCKLYKYLYENDCFSLKRKKDKFVEANYEKLYSHRNSEEVQIILNDKINNISNKKTSKKIDKKYSFIYRILKENGLINSKIVKKDVIEKIIIDIYDGLTLNEIGKKYNIDPSTVARIKKNKNVIVSKRISYEPCKNRENRTIRLYSLCNRNMGHNDIAIISDFFEISPDSVIRIINKNGYKTMSDKRKNNFSDEDIKYIKENYNCNSSYSSCFEISKTLNRSFSSIQHKVFKMGLTNKK